MTRALALLFFAACGAPICAGCADDAGGDELPATFQAQFVSLISSTDAACGIYIDGGITIADGAMTQSDSVAPSPYVIVDGGWEADIQRTASATFHWRVEPDSATTAIVSLEFNGCSASAVYGPAQ